MALAALAACGMMSNPPARNSSDSAASLLVPDASLGPSAAPGDTRALALMPQGSGAEGPVGSPVVVRGQSLARSFPRPSEGARAGAGPSGSDVTLNFAGADIRDVITAVLGHTLKLNYVIDPDVKGPVTFNVSRPIARDEVLPTLEAVLNSRGDTMVRTDGIIRVQALRPAGKPGIGGAGAALPIDGGGTLALGAGSEVFPMRFVAPSDMQHVLEKVLPPGQVIVADDAHRLLLVQGSANDLQVAEQTVRIFDIDALAGMSMALVPLHNADPEVVASELRDIFDASKKDSDTNPIRVLSIARLDAVMVMTRTPRYLDEAREWIRRLDRLQDANQRKVFVYNLQYGKAVDVAQKLQGLLSGLNIQFKAPGADTGTTGGLGEGALVPGAALAGTTDAAAKPGGGAKPILATAAEPAPAASPAAAAADTGVRIEADEAHNALLISATAKDYDLIRQVLDGIDVPPLEVLIEVTVAEVELNNQLNYGVQYFLNSGKGQALLTTGTLTTGVSPTVPGFALGLANGTSPQVILSALSELTQTKVVSTPRVLVLSNQTARLQVGDVVPIITQSATSTTTSNPLVVNNITYQETGVVLQVTPRVNASGYVTMDIDQSVSDVINTTTSTINSPTIEQRKLASTISVKSGQSILLGGLIQQQDNRDSAGIPYLQDIPGLGALFGTHTDSTARTELIMFLTPHVITNQQDAANVMQGVARQFQAVLNYSDMAPVRVPPR